MDLLAANFTGRVNDLDFILQAFRAVTEEDVPTRCVVHGMPGLGKTKLVLRFVQIVFSQLLYSHIFWMSASTPDKVIKGMTKVLDLVGHAERTRSEQDAKVTAARLWLEDSGRIDGVRWLLIFDNVDRSSLEFLREHLPRRNVKGNILFTTRSSDIADALVRVSGGCHSTLDLHVLDLAEATHLFFSSAGIDPRTVTIMQQNQAEELVQNLGCLPLAIVQAASYMSQTDMTLDIMLKVSEGERRIEMIEWESDLAADQQISVVTTFNTLFDQLEREFPESYNVLIILSFLDPEDIPLAMLTDGARMSLRLLDLPAPGNSQGTSSMIARKKITKWTQNRWRSQHHSQNNSSGFSNPLPEPCFLVSLLLSPSALAKVRHKLQSLSLVESLLRDGEMSLRMHDLVHFMAREHVKRRPAYQGWLESAVTLVCGAIQRVEEPNSPRWWPQCEKFIPHVRSLSKVWTGVNVNLVIADVYLARYLDSRGRYGDAEKLCEHSVGSLRKELGDKHRKTLWASYYLAHIHINQGRLTDAAEALDHVLAVQKEVLGADHQQTLATTNELGGVYGQQGRGKDAEELYKRVLAVTEKQHGLDHPHTLRTMNNLALGYYSQKRYGEAEELYKDVLARKETTLGPHHIDTLNTTHNLASVYLSQAKYNDAEQLYTRTLVGYEKQLGPSHPQTLTTAAHLACLYASQARDDEAERFYHRAITGMKQQLGVNHPNTLWWENNLAAFYRSQGRKGEAGALLDSMQG